jgi:hypothetical protein
VTKGRVCAGRRIWLDRQTPAPKAAIDISRLLHDAVNEPDCSIRPDTKQLANTPFQAVQRLGQPVFFGPNSLFSEFLSFFPFWHPCMSA